MCCASCLQQYGCEEEVERPAIRVCSAASCIQPRELHEDSWVTWYDTTSVPQQVRVNII
jgi:hypothetical protein